MFYLQFGISVALFSVCVTGIAFPGPLATPVVKRLDANGWTPKPTSEPRPLLELFRRQEDPSFCGYLEGDPDNAVTCSAGRSCLYDDRISWFGCCTGTAITDCNVNTACVESKSMSKCSQQSECINDSSLIACTEKSAPYCFGLYTVLSSETFGHFECGASDATYEIFSTATNGSASSASLRFSATETESTDIFFTDTEQTSRTRLSVPSRLTSADDVGFTSTEDITRLATILRVTSSSDTVESDTTSTTAESTSDATSTTTGGSPGVSQSPSQVMTTAGALRTAEAVVGAVGGVFGLVAILL